ncbi:hypothetical protein KVR01_010383 [Diaporthe batatas]|uniref:uncharacterized protein n=1 Tax=Diaporthe batatas TaxID=748121 RepID=UPI001D036539|nr:uncharacterized protein KVR01_010383 [Diaporthe batatas]KAG8159746.1 hypothetical protein KVR01_010383 [Diaporthe batatas]
MCPTRPDSPIPRHDPPHRIRLAAAERDDDPGTPPPPYVASRDAEPNHPEPSAARRELIIRGATTVCELSSRAITARALAKNPDSAAAAMANALEEIRTTTTTFLAARGIASTSSTGAYILDCVLHDSALEARRIADHRDEPDFAGREAELLDLYLAVPLLNLLATEARGNHRVGIPR